MCGIKITGENEFTIAPVAGGHFTYAKAAYKSIFGMVKSGWKKQGDTYVYEVTIPANCRAKIMINGRNEIVSGGTYTFS